MNKAFGERDMSNRFRVLLWLTGLVLILNSIAMRAYAVAIRSTYAFVASNTVFYPLAWLNFILGLIIILGLVWELWTKRGR